MEEIDEIQAKSVASNSENANPSKHIETSKAKEEGELSDSYGDENLGCFTGQSSGAFSPSLEANSAPCSVKSTPTNLAGKTVSGNLASTVATSSRQSIPTKSQQNIEKNQLRLKSNNPSWYAAAGGSNNLVIRFSDDDSGSDSEKCSLQKTVKHKSNSTLDVTCRPALQAAKKLNKLGQTSTNNTRAILKKPLSRAFISSMTKINGGANSRVSGPLVDQGSRVRYLNSQNKNLATQDFGCDQGVDLNSSKLHDLRQQIALRESELKLKASQLNKEAVSASPMNLDNGARRKWAQTSADTHPVDPKEPEKKRLKIGESGFTHLNSDAQRDVHPVKSSLVSKEQELETVNLQSRDMIGHSTKGVPISNAKSSIRCLKKDDKLVDVPLEDISKIVKDGADLRSNFHQFRSTSKQVGQGDLTNQTASLTSLVPGALPNNVTSMKLNHPNKVCLRNPQSSSLRKPIREQSLTKSSDFHEDMSFHKKLEPYFTQKFQTSQNTANLRNRLDDVNISGNCNGDINSLMELEDKLDKELEEAQQHRHMCETEERNALKAYRKAQRALVEANARCTDLYRQRELCSAHFRSFFVDDSSSLWSSRQPEHTVIGKDTSHNVLENMDIVPISTRSLQPDYDCLKEQAFDPDTQCISVAPRSMSPQHENGQNLGCYPCSEPDASTSEQFQCNSNAAANGVRSPCSPIVSADENEETSPMDHDSVEPSSEYLQKKQNAEVVQKNTNNVPNSQDSLLLEATLRSELYARLRKRNSSKKIDSGYHGEHTTERGTENDVGSEKTQMSNGSLKLLEAEKVCQFGDSGPEKPNELSEALLQNEIQCHEKRNLSTFLSVANPEDDLVSVGWIHSAASIILSPSFILRSAVGDIKVMASFTGQKENRDGSEKGGYVNFGEIEWSGQIVNSLKETVLGLAGREMASYMCNISVDPFWPLCMYELRGKCNNDKCPFQHVKDFSKRNASQNVHDDSNSNDSELALTSCEQQSNGPTKPSKYHDIVISPTYIVSLDVLKANPQPNESVVAGRNTNCWWKCFSICLTLSSSLLKGLPTVDPLLDGSDGRIEVHGSWYRESSYFQSRNGILNKLNQALDMNAQALEMALLILNQDVNKLEAVKKVLSLLSRALEDDAASETLWVVYLLIFYSHMTLVGKDDMFSYAVKNNEGSYELWLMYINSRKQLDDRLVAYDAALASLCHSASSPGKDDRQTSACILDLFLQMLECLCIAGNVEKAVQTIYRLLTSTTNSDGHHSLMFTDILTCLTVSDKCVLWVSCTYLVIYRKLPGAVLQRLEHEKELLPIEWPSVHLDDDEKKRVVQFLEMAVSCVDSCINVESFKSEIDHRSAQVLAINHIRCMMALDNSDCNRNLLEKYMNLYPSCLELVLMSARERKNESGDSDFVGFEEALNNWPKEAPGIQCLWNQYADFAQQNGKPDFVKTLMTRWYDSVWKVKYPESENLNTRDGGNPFVAQESGSTLKPGILTPNFVQMDVMFGFLNLFLYKFLENDHSEARLAIDQALRAATTPMGFSHCVKEHALFLLSDKSQKESLSINWQLNTLNMYLDVARRFLVSEPLSRNFIRKIAKSRVQHLVRNMLSPASSDFSVVNLVLEAWYGPCLLPQNMNEPRNLVDFVETILSITPSNYELVFSVCKMLSKGDNYIYVPTSLLFWASSTLVDAIFCAVPIPSEYVWVKAAGILSDVPGIKAILTRFHKKALSVYPFSLKLWKCYQNLTKE